ncbi:MAG: hypothetical protein NT094_02735, partial [Candidatus Staskawiczbacteria bacterium]|nr:hypothetical protein [Candidatus Staskawiczbacteria bacterium]
MVEITEKQLIKSLKQMKEIKPNKQWAILLKSQILSEDRSEVKITAQKVNFLDAISSILSQRKFVYSFAVILFTIVGFFGFAEYTSLNDQVSLQQSAAALSDGINNLALVSKEGKKDNLPVAINEVRV